MHENQDHNTYHFHFTFDETLLLRIDNQKETLPERCIFTDRYYDSLNHSLLHNNLWLKKRDFEWSLKKCHAEGDVIHGEEYIDEQQICDILKLPFTKLMDAENVKSFCTMTTYRLVYNFSNFLVHLDCVDFGSNQYYLIGKFSSTHLNHLSSYFKKLTSNNVDSYPARSKIFQWLYWNDQSVYNTLKDVTKVVGEYKLSESKVNILKEIKSIPLQPKNAIRSNSKFEIVTNLTALCEQPPQISVPCHIPTTMLQNVLMHLEMHYACMMDGVQISNQTKAKIEQIVNLFESKTIDLPSILCPSVHNDGTIDFTIKANNVEWVIAVCEDCVDIFKLQDGEVEVTEHLLSSEENDPESISKITKIFSNY